MFEQTFVPESNRTRSGASLFISLAAQVLVLIVLILIPLVYTEALPPGSLRSILTAPAPPPPAPPPAPVPQVMVKPAQRQFDMGVLHAPSRVPEKIALITDDSLPPAASIGVQGSIPGISGVPDGVIKGVLEPVVAPAAPPRTVTPVKEKPVQRVNVSSGVIQASLIRRVVPPYPPLARAARVQGTVQFTAIIGRDGTIQNLQLISGSPLLVRAARDAIRQWVYKPTILNSEPVEVITQIEFTFRLN